MKVAVLIKRFVKTGGAERYAYELTRRIARHHKVHVFSHIWEYDGAEDIIFHNVPNPVKKPTWLNQWLYAYYCWKILERENFDVVHSHEKVFSFDIMTVHSPCFKTHLLNRKWFEKILFAALSPRKLAWLLLEWIQFCKGNNKVFVAVSRNVMENVMACYKLDRRRFHVIYPGVEQKEAMVPLEARERERLRRYYGIAPDDTLYLFVGNEFKRKGLHTLLEAFSKLKEERSKLLVVGDGGGRFHEFKRLSAKLGCKDKVVFVGHVKDVVPFYRISDVFVMPTLSDPFGMAAVEADMFGLPVIVSQSRYCGASECLQHNSELILMDPTDHLELLERLKTASHMISSRVSNKGRPSFSVPTWDEVAKLTLDLYSRITQITTFPDTQKWN